MQNKYYILKQFIRFKSKKIVIVTVSYRIGDKYLIKDNILYYKKYIRL